MAITLIRKLDPLIATIAAAVNGAHKAAVGSNVHYGASEVTITAANASDLATSLTLVNQILGIYNGLASGVSTYPGHRLDSVAHLATDTTNTIAAPVATDLTTAQTLANELKTDYNLHRSQSGVHANADGGNAITSANATDQSSLNTLLNELKTDINAHMAAAATGAAPLRAVAG